MPTYGPAREFTMFDQIREAFILNPVFGLFVLVVTCVTCYYVVMALIIAARYLTDEFRWVKYGPKIRKQAVHLRRLYSLAMNHYREVGEQMPDGTTLAQPIPSDLEQKINRSVNDLLELERKLGHPLPKECDPFTIENDFHVHRTSTFGELRFIPRTTGTTASINPIIQELDAQVAKAQAEQAPLKEPATIKPTSSVHEELERLVNRPEDKGH